MRLLDAALSDFQRADLKDANRLCNGEQLLELARERGAAKLLGAG